MRKILSTILLLFLLLVPPPNSQVLKSFGSFISDAVHPFFLLFEELFSRNYVKNPGCMHSSSSASCCLWLSCCSPLFTVLHVSSTLSFLGFSLLETSPSILLMSFSSMISLTLFTCEDFLCLLSCRCEHAANGVVIMESCGKSSGK